MPGMRPWTVTESLWHTPQALTRNRTSRDPGSGRSRSIICRLAPASGTIMARIFDIDGPPFLSFGGNYARRTSYPSWLSIGVCHQRS